ncbi:MAG TPA: hypothetical protein VLF59_05110 [Candidatus Saccharimonadales bacterium]|nr:hypothetical protein [Candidatus Saccharimonadales bacterium]
MRASKTRFGAVVTGAAIFAAMVGSMPASAATVSVTPASVATASTAPAAAMGLHQQWVYQPSHLQGAKEYSLQFANGSTLDPGLETFKAISSYAGADIERVKPLGVSLTDIENQLVPATSGDPAQAGPAMDWFARNTEWHSGLPYKGQGDFLIVESPGSYYVAQITPGLVAKTALPYTVRSGTATGTLPATTQTLKMLSNNTFSVVGGTGLAPKIHRSSLLRVENDTDGLHFARFLTVPAGTTAQQATDWCHGSNPSLTPGAADWGVGTMSSGIVIDANPYWAGSGLRIAVDYLPNRHTGVSSVTTMCQPVTVV